MAESPGQFVGTWTAYPSLLASLPPEERAALEDAASAHYCGRYQEASTIFDSRLPKSHTKPLLALQRADMLTAQGREHDRIHMLKQALDMLPDQEVALAPVRLLFTFMLANAECWASGKMKDAVSLLPAVRRHLASCGIDHLSDVEVITFLKL